MPPAGQTARRNPLSHELGVGCNSSSALQRRRCRPLPAGGSQDFDPESAAPNPKPHAPSAAAAVRAGREHGRKAKRARGQRRGGGAAHIAQRCLKSYCGIASDVEAAAPDSVLPAAKATFLAAFSGKFPPPPRFQPATPASALVTWASPLPTPSPLPRMGAVGD